MSVYKHQLSLPGKGYGNFFFPEVMSFLCLGVKMDFLFGNDGDGMRGGFSCL